MESEYTNRDSEAPRDDLTPTAAENLNNEEVPVNEIQQRVNIIVSSVCGSTTSQIEAEYNVDQTALEHQRSETQVEAEQILRLGLDKESVNSNQEHLKIETVSISSSTKTTIDDTFENTSTEKGLDDSLSQQMPTHFPCPTSSGEPFRLILAGSVEQIHSVSTNKPPKVQIEAPDTGPKLYDIKTNSISAPLIPAQLPEVFKSLPAFVSPTTPDLRKKTLREFVGGDLNEEEFDKLGEYCSIGNLKTGSEILMPTCYPRTGFSAYNETKEHLNSAAGAQGAGNHLKVIRKHKMLLDKDKVLCRRLKYRGVRFLRVNPNAEEEEEEEAEQQPPLVPGKDMLFKVRFYRQFPYSPRERKRTGSRHPVFQKELVLLGRHTLAELRARIACVNEQGLPVDRSLQPDHEPTTSCKELFPSGFLFINNVFYNDLRPGCQDCSAPIREWAKRRDIGCFPARDMAGMRLDQLTIKLGYPEVYVHQGNCEHLFTFSEVRLVGPTDPLDASLYPRYRSTACYNSVYCTTCAEFPANWVVTRCPRVPFDPALFCDTCFRLYLYKGGEKLGDFTAVRLKVNEPDSVGC